MPIEQIIKRNGKIVPFEKDKITEAIWKAVISCGGKDKEKTAYLSDSIVKQLNDKRIDQIPTVEEVQDLV